MKFGDRLRQAREARGISLDAIVQETHIARRYLEALEQSQLEALPGGIFNRGYIRSYAQVVGIDPQPVLAAYQAAERRLHLDKPESDEILLHELSQQAERRSGRNRVWPLWATRGKIAGALLALSVLLVGVWFLSSPPSGVAPQVASRPVLPSPTPPEPVEPSRPEQEDAPPRRASETDRSSRLSVPEAALGTAIVEHVVVGRNDRFPEGTRVFFWTRVVGGERGVVLHHVWKTDGEVVMNSPLAIGGPHWRTYSSYTLPPGSAGTWTVEAVAPDGSVLAREEFICSSSPDLETRRQAILDLARGD
jgi:cytoskeletal protein RodZ